MGRIKIVNEDRHGNVRSTTVKVAKYKYSSSVNDDTNELERPIVKLILLKSIEDLYHLHTQSSYESLSNRL